VPLELSTSDADFAQRFAAFVDAGRETATDVSATVSGIIADVRARGDAALFELTQRFDRLDTTTLRFTDAEISAAKDTIDPDFSARRLSLRRSASAPFTSGSFHPTMMRWTRWACAPGGAGPRSTMSASTCRAGSPAIPRPC